ncbi:hypothetical protein BJ138DRAFT_1170604 [Hygrophoropsis aurantiaca]|uniref:Uncharacterized protein n=1 Tax=Hygrophoropsis aurantiaca TaxID=72124 RepID=A0ACB8AMF9_9AGAM|nr:hypothetical protein BJ138DRAFT_1170604 [Hygrophoropsis aurantiaca]
MAERRGTHTQRKSSESSTHSQASGFEDHELLPVASASSPSAARSCTEEDLEAVPEKPLEYAGFRDRFQGKGKHKVGILRSIFNIYTCSWLNILMLVTPLAWFAHWWGRWSSPVVFALCFLALIPHEKLFDFYGEQLSLYCGKDLGDLIVITLNNVVEATLAIILLFKCELKLLQSTITGVVLLHLLLIPGAAFITGGARIWEQDLHPAHTQLNHTLLTVGVLSLLLPAAFYAAVNPSSTTVSTTEGLGDKTTVDFLAMSRGLAILLLLIYVTSRIFYHNPHHNMRKHPTAPKQLREEDEELARTEPKVNIWVCLLFVASNTAIMAVTAEWLVDSIESVREEAIITQEFFGMVLLPIVSFSADGVVAIVYFLHRTLRHVIKIGEPEPPTTLAKAEAIDLSIQFVLLWMPIMVILGWIAGKPFSLLFDFFEVALLLGACFLVNYVTADSKTNWAEGVVLFVFYSMMVLCAWFYTGESVVSTLLLCAGQAAEEPA